MFGILSGNGRWVAIGANKGPELGTGDVLTGARFPTLDDAGKFMLEYCQKFAALGDSFTVVPLQHGIMGQAPPRKRKPRAERVPRSSTSVKFVISQIADGKWHWTCYGHAGHEICASVGPALATWQRCLEVIDRIRGGTHAVYRRDEGRTKPVRIV